MPIISPRLEDVTWAAVNTLATRETFQERVTPNPTQRTTLIVAGCYVVAIGILW